MERALREKLAGGKFQGVTPERSRHMQSVRGKGNKSTERRLRAALSRAELRGWVLHPTTLPGRPDFLFEDSKLALFVDGCFWHGCRRCGHIPRTNSGFWAEKVKRNRARDAKKTRELRSAGYNVLRLWEHDLADLARCIDRVRSALTQPAPSPRRRVSLGFNKISPSG